MNDFYMTWFFHNTPTPFTEEDIADHIGFVYLISHIKTGKKYIGKKLYTKSKTKQVKGKKKRTRVSSDWMDYWGSNTELQEEVKKNGVEEYTREILYLCKTRSEMTYWETWEIFNRHALLNESYYNKWVMARVRKDHLKNIKQDN